ncbi:glutamine amidotransferase [Schumannella luteola]|uniref:GMP synthase (Glutamine-hydrolyzing) n=1 Tax=Schumannella luteola TaxID=472059 RepID=A0A852Y8J1_9MICO|nr:glutamine amidotransferase [Schumannella luteola]NYG97624.1 GMP synthase (glutamine-hydrolyzing) [Schumannella luteola]TPX04677.1 glutamine amidotransferase [Schumannella luteola]
MSSVLVITSRDDETALAAEVRAISRFGGVPTERIHHHRADLASLDTLDAADFAAVVVTGSPFTVTDPDDEKSATQKRVEAELQRMLDRVLDRDIPFFGACYGVGTLGLHEGAVIDRQYGEDVAAIPIRLTDAGRADPVFGTMPEVFHSYVGHKEAISALPAHAVLLATGENAPVQAFRVGEHQYATQFHPELAFDDLAYRVGIYRENGYFAPEELDAVLERAGREDVSASHDLLRAFLSRYL